MRKNKQINSNEAEKCVCLVERKKSNISLSRMELCTKIIIYAYNDNDDGDVFHTRRYGDL